MQTRVAVITGASRGIGLATALRLAKAGWTIVAAARHADDLAAAAEQVRGVGGDCVAVPLDVSRPPEARRLIEAAVERTGRLDALINNAGCAPLAPLDRLTDADFEAVTALNMGAVFQTCRAAWPVLCRQGGGVIVNVSSLASVDPFPGFSLYGASKAWVNLFSRSLAAEGKPHGIRVFAVAPGAVETRLLRGLFPNFPADQTLAPDDVAAVIEAACDPRVARCSGETLFVRP